MNNLKRIFMVMEAGKSTAITNLDFPSNEAVEVVDLTTRCTLKVKAGEVSLYRHILHFHGKCFNILNIRECAC